MSARGPTRRRPPTAIGRAAGAALLLGLSAPAGRAQDAGGGAPGPASPGGSDAAGPRFSPPSPPLSGGSAAGLGFGPSIAPAPGAPAGGLGAFGVQGGVASEPGQPTGPTREYTITPRIDVSESYNSNIDASGGGFGGSGGSGGFGGRQRSDFVTYITPSIAVAADTPRLQGSLFYAPTVQLYASNGAEDSVGHNLNANATLTVLGDTLFVNAGAYAAVQPRFGGLASSNFGGFNGAGATNLSRNQQTQTSSFSIEPYAVHRFGDYGTAKIAYSFTQSQSDQNGEGSGVFQGLPQQNLLAGTGNASLTTSRETGQFTTGDFPGRVRGVTVLSASQYGGGGVSSGAYENLFSQQLGYAITHQLTVFAEGGYEDIRYDTFPVTKIDDEIWSVGARVTPNPDSTATFGYGHKFGFNSAFLNGSYAPTARTRLTAVYTSGLGTALQGLQDAIGNSTLDAFGNPVDFTTGAPTFLSSGQVGVTGNNALYRIRTLSLTASAVYDRDVFSLSFSSTDQTLIGTARGTNGLSGFNGFDGLPLASSQSSYTGVGSWRHDLSPELSASADVSYGRTRSSGLAASSQNVGADVTLSQVFTDTLSGYVRYSFLDRISDVPGFGYTQHIIQVGVSKTF